MHAKQSRLLAGRVRTILTSTVALALSVFASCRGPTDALTNPPNSEALLSSADTVRTWLPVGTVVPVGVDLQAPPEPFDPARHPLLSPGATFTNLAGTPGFENFPKMGAQALARSPPPPGNGDRGFWLDQTSRPWFGMSAMYDLNLSLGLPTPRGGHDIYIYAPTTQAPGGACIEVTQVYRTLSGGATTGKYFRLWDWCNAIKFVVMEAQVTTWTNRYVRTYQGKPMYAMSIATPNTGYTYGQCWFATLYDFLLGGWVQKLQECGTPLTGYGATGWTMWESWYLTNGSYPTLQSIRALDINLYDPQTGTAVPFTNWPSDYHNLGPNGVCWPTGPYTFESPVSGLGANSWRGNTPNP